MDLIGLLLIALVVVVGYKLSPLLLPAADVTVLPAAACDVNRTPCAAALPEGGQVELSILPRPVPLASPFRVEVAVGRDAGRVEVDFAGADMDMGFNRVTLAALGNGKYGGEASLPVCITGKMAWLATVIVETPGQRVAIPYRFVTEPR